MSKKQRRTEPKQGPTKRQLSKWQRQRRIQRIIIIVAALFLIGIVGYVGYGYYNSKIGPLREVVITVNDASFDMGYYVDTLDAYTKGVEPEQIYYMANFVADQIVQSELIKQGAKNLGLSVTDQEIGEKIEEDNLPNEKIYQDMVRATLLHEKLLEHFDSPLSAMNQTRIQVMLVESEKVADEVVSKIEDNGNFTALVEEFSCNPDIEGDLGWLPEELMPNSLIANATSSLEPNEMGKIYDESATKNVGYWLIKVTDKQGEEIKTLAMLLGSEEEAAKVKAELENGGNFTELAGEYSQHESKDKGGDLGWLKRGDMGSDAFDNVAFSLSTGMVSELVQDKSVETKGGYWIIKVLAKGEHELSEEIRDELAQNKFEAWFEGQKENSTINYPDEDDMLWAVERVIKERQ